MRRVVFTGFGTVNALALDGPGTLQAFREGRCGIGQLGFRDAERLTIRIGAEVKGAAQAVDVGPVWLVAELADIAALEELKHDEARLSAFYMPRGMTGATLYATDGTRVVLRSFAPGDGIAEDPVCGSGNGAVAAFRLAAGQVAAGDGAHCVKKCIALTQHAHLIKV